MTHCRLMLRAAALTGAALAAAGLLTACSHGGGGESQSAGHPAAASSQATQSQPASSATPTPAAPSASPSAVRPATAQPVAAGPGMCTTGDLSLAVGAANGAAGSFYYPLQFTNISGTTCTMYGYPGVALVTQQDGSIVGAAAVRNPTFPAEVVTLAPGGVAHASLQVAVAANYTVAACGPVTAHWLQVFPPGNYAALFVPFTAQTCSKRVGDGSTLGIYVVRPGATGP
jgi:Protein of unknown function (DUF4232)